MAQHDTASGVQKKPRILVADDMDVNHKIARLILEKAGYRVDVVENGQQAVAACRQHSYDLILMDIQMPVMDGHEATKKIRKLEKKLKAQSSKLKGRGSEDLSAFSFELSARAQRVPIIALTGSAGPGGFDETRYPGMNDCIGKPLQRDFLLSLVQKWLSPESATGGIENQADDTPAMDKRPAKDQFPLDLERAIQEFMGRKDILMGVLQDFIINAGSRIDTIRWAVEGADYDVIGSEAHAIRGAAANLAADNLARLASDLEQASGRQQPDLMQEKVDKLGQELFNLKRQVQQLRDA